MKALHFIVGFLFIGSFLACKKFVAVPPPINQVTSQTVFTSDATAMATVNGIFSQMMNDPNQFTSSLATLYPGLSADEFTNYSPGNLDELRLNKISYANHAVLQSGFWQPAYKYIYTANLILEGLQGSATLTPAIKTQLTGEAKFIRAFCYFYLVNLFGDVPLVTSSTYRENAVLARTAANTVYQQIIRDLEEARQALPANDLSGEKTVPGQWAATALLARAYLFTGNWTKAVEATRLLIKSGRYRLVPVREVFLRNSAEAIWQLQPVSPVYNTYEAATLFPASASTAPTYVLTPGLVNAFEPGDQRKKEWDTVRVYNGDTLHFAVKYKVNGLNLPRTEYYTVLRLAEIYLIQAEAEANLGELPAALEDLNAIRRRAGLADFTSNSAAGVRLAIEAERRVELFAEWGHRWLDLKRTGRAGQVLGNSKPAWTATAALWPIPQQEINLNPGLTQNPGY